MESTGGTLLSSGQAGAALAVLDRFRWQREHLQLRLGQSAAKSEEHPPCHKDHQVGEGLGEDPVAKLDLTLISTPEFLVLSSPHVIKDAQEALASPPRLASIDPPIQDNNAERNIEYRLAVDELAHQLVVLRISTEGRKAIGIREIDTLVARFEQHLLRDDIASGSDYITITQEVVQEGIEVLKELVGSYLPADKLDVVRAQPIVPEAPECGLAEYEVSFGGGGSCIVFPNAHAYTAQHREIWTRYAPRPNRLYRDHEIRCLCSPMHELIHCVQSIAGDSDTQGWAAEYEASFGCLNLLARVCQNVREKLAGRKSGRKVHPAVACLCEGRFEQVVLHVYETVVRHLHPTTATAEAIRAYERWRETFGKEGPNRDSWQSFEDDSAATRAMKDRIALEAWNDGEGFENTLRTFFEPGRNEEQLRQMSNEYLGSTKLEDMERPSVNERFNAKGEWDRVLPLMSKVQLFKQ